MEIDLFDIDSDNTFGLSKDKENEVEKANYKDILKGRGLMLGLDLSKESSGIAEVQNDGSILVWNSRLGDYNDDPMREYKLRAELKEDLQRIVKRKHYSVIVIEDVYSGLNRKTDRLLYALNTVIDEIITNGVCKVDNFIRVQNTKWKSWLKGITAGIKAVNDKVKIREALRTIGIEQDGKGYQDRLDAIGMVVGYCLSEEEIKKETARKRIKNKNIRVVYVSFEEDLNFAIPNEIRDEKGVRYFNNKVTMDFIKDSILEDQNSIWVGEEEQYVGWLADKFKLPLIEGGGYIAFWYDE